MEFTAFLFYVFSFLAVIAGVLVVSSKNPVHSVLWLIFAFFNSAGLFILLGAEMLAMLLVIVYVGAVAVLFLFVVMMLNIKTNKIKKGFQTHLPLGLLLAVILLAEIIMVVNGSVEKLNIAKETVSMEQLEEQAAELKTDVVAEETPATEAPKNTLAEKNLTNAESIGAVLYTRYILYFQLCGLILLVAMIGAIVLTLRHRTDVRRQKISEQLKRDLKTVEMVKVESGQGIE